MTKLNHQRPELIYLDNIRRELKHMAAGATNSHIPPDYFQQIDAFLAANPKAGTQSRPHDLNPKEEKLATDMLVCLEKYIDAQSSALNGFFTNGNKRNRKIEAARLARTALCVACLHFWGELMISAQHGRKNLFNWWEYIEREFRKHEMVGHGSAWETLNSAVEESTRSFFEVIETRIRKNSE